MPEVIFSVYNDSAMTGSASHYNMVSLTSAGRWLILNIYAKMTSCHLLVKIGRIDPIFGEGTNLGSGNFVTYFLI